MCIKTFTKHMIKDGQYKKFELPCGKCPLCVKAKLQAWLFRLNQELKVSTNPRFVTLTYNRKSVPYIEGRKTVSKKDVQDFMKRLRKAHAKMSNVSLKYYFVAEYGSKRGRPHYHAILFNLEDARLIHKCWGRGHTFSPKLNPRKGGVSYVLKYISKPPTRHPDDPREKEFSLISKGIGSNYLSESIKDYHRNELTNCFVTRDNGVKMSIPKYYKEKLYDDDMREQVSLILQDRVVEIQQQKHRSAKLMRPRGTKNNPIQNLALSAEFSKLPKKFETVDLYEEAD